MSLITKKSRLVQRQNIVRAIRAALDDRGYLEIPAPLFIRGTNPDAFLTSFEVLAEEKFCGYLTTSTEFQLLRLCAAGYEKVYTLTSNFRFGDLSRTHNPEFTMLEWEAANVDMETIEKEAEEIILAASGALRPSGIKAFERISVREAFKKHLGINVAPDFSLESMREEIKRVGLEAPKNFLDDQGLLFSWLIDKVSPNLGLDKPIWVYEWPIFQTCMAEPVKGNPKIAERSELYIAGLEIANGFAAVSDAEKQKALFTAQQARRVVEGKKEVVLDEKYLSALAVLDKMADRPFHAAGMAMGLDRLVMLLTGASEISEVMAFGWGEL